MSLLIGLVVRTAIELDNQLCLDAGEVANICTDRNLAAELGAGTAAAQAAPKDRLGECHLAA